MGRITKVIGFSVPPALAQEVEQLARRERRTKSELFREMLRVYQRYTKQREQEEERWVTDLIREAQEEQAKHPLSPEELVAAFNEIAQYGARQAKKLGIKSKDINCIIHASRQRRRAT